MPWAAFDSLLKEVEVAAKLDVAFVLTATGDLLAGWSRDGLRQEVISVMAATMTASVDTLLEELRGHRPDLVTVEAGGQRFVVSRTMDGNLLVLAASSTVSKRQLLSSARALQTKLAELGPKGKPRRHLVSPLS